MFGPVTVPRRAAPFNPCDESRSQQSPVLQGLASGFKLLVVLGVSLTASRHCLGRRKRMASWFCFLLLLWKRPDESNLEEKGFISAHSSRLHGTVVGKLMQQAAEVAGHTYSQEQRQGTCMLVPDLPSPLSSGAGTRPTGWCCPRQGELGLPTSAYAIKTVLHTPPYLRSPSLSPFLCDSNVIVSGDN